VAERIRADLREAICVHEKSHSLAATQKSIGLPHGPRELCLPRVCNKTRFSHGRRFRISTLIPPLVRFSSGRGAVGAITASPQTGHGQKEDGHPISGETAIIQAALALYRLAFNAPWLKLCASHWLDVWPSPCHLIGARSAPQEVKVCAICRLSLEHS
jgi:hypothetical protein